MVAHLEVFDQASLSRPKDNEFHSEGICNLGPLQLKELGTPVFCAGFSSEDDNRRCFLGKLTGNYYLWCYCKCLIF